MARTRIFVDIRKHRSDSSFVVELVRCYCSRFPGASLAWLVRPNQAHLIPPETILGEADELDKSWGPRLRDQLVQSAQADQDAPGGAILVLSYDNFVLSDARAAAAFGVAVTATHISELFKMGVHRAARLRQIHPPTEQPGRPQASGGRWAGPRSTERSLFLNFGPRPVGPPLTAVEAEHLAKTVLRSGGFLSSDIALPQKDLRPRMTALDPRAARRFGDPESETLITNLVDTGLQQGWLKRVRRIPGRTGTEMLYFVDSAPSAAGAPVSPTTDNSTLEPHRVSAVPGTSEKLDSARSGSENLSHSAEVTQAAEGKRKKHPNRATEFEAILTKSRIGAMPESRERAFEAVAAIITENKGAALPLLELFRNAIARAKVSAERDGYIVEKNWHVVQLCVRRLMLWAGALLDQDGQPITDKIGSSAKEVTTLADDFRLICKAYLVEHLIERSGGINYDDETYYIGLTIYRRGIERAVPADELKAKADAVLAYLEDKDRIYLDSNRMLRAKSPKTRALAVAG